MNTIKLGELVSISGGGTPDRSNPDFWGGDIPWATVKDFKSLEISSTLECITDEGLKGSAANIAAPGSIIVPTRMALGKAAINTIPVAINQDLKALRVLDPNVLDRDYLFRFLLSKATYLESKGQGATVKGITLNVLRDLDVPVPPIREQQRIATILDKADSLRCKRQEAIRLADEVLKAAFVDMFGAPSDVAPSLPTQPLGDVCRFYAGNSLPEGEPFAGQLDGVLHIKVGDMNLPGNESVVSTSREWSANGTGGIVAPQGAILIPKRGGAIATNKKRLLGRSCALDPNLMAISPGPDLRQELLFQWFKLFDLSTITSGSAVPQLNKGDLAPLRIVVPPRDQQDRFAAIAQRVTSIINKQVTQLGDIESACRALTDGLLVA